MARPRAPQINHAIVTINDVDVPNRTAHVIDKLGGKFQVQFDIGHPVVSVPVVGDKWIICRSQYDWYFDQRVEEADSDRIPTTSLAIGDTKIRSGGTVHFDAAGMAVNGYAFGIMTWERFILAADTSTIQLLFAPLDIRSVQVYNNRSLVDPFGITLSDTARTLAFSPALSQGTVIIYYQYIPDSIKVDDLLSDV